MRQPRRRTVLAGALGIVVMLLVSACDVLPPAPPGGETASCDDIGWGSGAKTAARMSTAPITGVRAGRHHCYDRLVIDLGATPAAGWYVAYGTVSEPGSGQVVPVRGTDMGVVVRAPAHDADYNPTYAPANPSEAVDVTGFSTFRQVAFLESFEGQTTFALGVRARLPFRVFATEHTGRAQLVVDVAHRWP
ncbi:hypothetical protein HC251_14235 [Iamia sp. SCSIO 61187]|uniref:AMIN-like domain-containing (lipo)protein n=1 Tax=Iamia sp. SCSIO 61187 TaxID=2722752 RepID=UPI001C6357A6|nr:hypothetical protein [Iamia sp. SCSIO 61187]QYG93467.1 hypothetical protein HC251_14235 [Iamia sp. SCSIO 61187]